MSSDDEEELIDALDGVPEGWAVSYTSPSLQLGIVSQGAGFAIAVNGDYLSDADIKALQRVLRVVAVHEDE